MNKYRVTVSEVLLYYYEVEAVNETDAYDKVFSEHAEGELSTDTESGEWEIVDIRKHK